MLIQRVEHILKNPGQFNVLHVSELSFTAWLGDVLFGYCHCWVKQARVQKTDRVMLMTMPVSVQAPHKKTKTRN